MDGRLYKSHAPVCFYIFNVFSVEQASECWLLFQDNTHGTILITETLFQLSHLWPIQTCSAESLHPQIIISQLTIVQKMILLSIYGYFFVKLQSMTFSECRMQVIAGQLEGSQKICGRLSFSLSR
ncbi:hypothetical protein CHARACLAT_018825 [Characodon lateralis]|uniref:Uncharacterized protein n=1 Tax=Characodon lateralis TaxID=208331 RepID=A0ABU7EF28_9TELE|nr:hypothetical protein [Characodon lateralis]